MPSFLKDFRKEVSKKIRDVIKSRGINQSTAAKQLGVHRSTLSNIISGKELPAPQLSERIARWMFDNITYEDSPTMYTRPRVKPTGNVRQLRVLLPEYLWQKIKARADSIGIGSQSYCMLAIQRMLEFDRNTLTIDKAVRALEAALVAELLNEAPGLYEIVYGDRELASHEDRAPRPAGKAALHQAPTNNERIAEAQIEDGPVSRTYIDPNFSELDQL